MSEMLGNHFFMVRDFPAALLEYEELLKQNSSLKKIKKKLVICYIQTGRVSEAFKLFRAIVSKDIRLITRTNVVKDDCPCPEIIERFSNLRLVNQDSLDHHLSLGMLWLYCNAEKSLLSFQRAKELAVDSFFINEIEIVSESIVNYLQKLKN